MAFGRRDILRGSLALGGLAGLQGCTASIGGPRTASAPPLPLRRPGLVPMRMSVDEIIDVKCCIRPFRPQGPRLDAEQIGDTLVIHNYGHGGSGWSLSWGSAEVAVGKAMTVLPQEIAVIGCGVIGLTTAVVAQRAGAKVTIYAKEMFPRTRSVRAYGSWTPDSRIALTDPAGPGFGDLWEQMARISWKSFRSYLGLPERPVDFSDQYSLSDGPFRPEGEEHGDDTETTDSYATKGLPQRNSEFAYYSDRIHDIVPRSEPLAAEDNPFDTRFARRQSQMYFNFGSYGHLLLSEFFQQGGTFENRAFHSPADVKGLKEKVVINSTGYAARDLWRDRTIIPVRGQTGWLVPQTEARYGVYYNNIALLSKSDGIAIMNFTTGLGDMLGVNDSTELPDRADTEEAIRLIAPLFDRMKGRPA